MTPARAKPPVAVSSCQKAVRVPHKEIVDLVSHVAAAEAVRFGEIDIAVVDGNHMAALHRRWLGKAGATDVLCFDLSDAVRKGLCAQIVVCGDVAARQGKLRRTGGRYELLLYVVHGLLHLIGHDDKTARGAARMHAREEELLDAFLRRPRRKGRKRPRRGQDR